ncbi:hypothetical protein [Piscinibacter sp.]|uniref:hypothetical protein n=1 Tax=Piscinibacter sp. TaxID=1903157 RepID=UPI0039E3950C
MASKSSKSVSTTEQNFYDQRAITTIDDRDTTTSYDLSDRSTSSYVSDSSNRSTTNTTITGFDPGVARIVELQSQLAGAVTESGSDTLRAVAGLGMGAFNDLTGSLSNLSATNERAWSHTVDSAEKVITGLLAGAKDSTDAAKSLAASAIASYQPSENKSADTFKWIGVALAVALGLGFVLKA